MPTPLKVRSIEPHPELPDHFIVNGFTVPAENLSLEARMLLKRPPLEPGPYLLPRCLEAYFASAAYVSESTEYSNILGPCFWADLVSICPLLRQRWKALGLTYKVDAPLVEFGQRPEDIHKWDLVVGPRAQMSPSTQQAPRDRLTVLGRDFSEELRDPDFRHWYETYEHPVRSAVLACEMKASIAKGNPTVRYGELELGHYWAHERCRETLVVAFTVVNPEHPSSLHTVETMLQLRIRPEKKSTGLDANIIVPYGPKAAKMRLPEHVQYGVALRELARRYEAIWPTAGQPVRGPA